jgi:Putative zinc-finger
MDHGDAIRLKTAEAYLLDELSLSERRDFEEHFFTCQQCTNDLKAGAAFIDAYKMANHAEPAPRLAVVKARHPQTFRSVYALAASVVFAFLLVYQNSVTIPRLKQSAKAGPVESFSLESTASRGSSPTVIAPSQGKPFVILLDIPPAGGQSGYRCVIRSEAGAELASFQVSAASAQRTVPVLIPGSELKPGKFSLNISREPRGTEDGGSVAQYPFEIR